MDPKDIENPIAEADFRHQLSAEKRQCKTCKHFGAQGRIGLVEETGKERYCAAYLFNMFLKDFKPMPEWKVTHGKCLDGTKGVLMVHEEFGCINHNPKYD